MQMVSDKAMEGTVVLAQYQTRGRGQAGSYWESEAGKNLLMSLILEPVFLEAGRQFFLSMIVSLALTEVLQKYVQGVCIKWPNDIYVDERKIAGILIENQVKGATLEKSVIGVGLNINQKKFESDAPNPVSLNQLTSKDYSPKVILDQFLETFSVWYNQLKMGEFQKIEEDYLAALFRRNEWGLYRDANGEFDARIIGIGEFGRLKLEVRSGEIKSYFFKEVEFVI